jgi:hypothetical protein
MHRPALPSINAWLVFFLPPAPSTLLCSSQNSIAIPTCLLLLFSPCPSRNQTSWGFMIDWSSSRSKHTFSLFKRKETLCLQTSQREFHGRLYEVESKTKWADVMCCEKFLVFQKHFEIHNMRALVRTFVIRIATISMSKFDCS